MLSLEQCERILNKDSENYNKEQLEVIREFISDLVDVYLKTTKLTCYEKNRSDLHKGIDRCAS